MMKITKAKTIVIATALTTLLSATAVIADTKSSRAEELPIFHQIHQTQTYETYSFFKSHIDSLVSVGTLTQDQGDAIQSEALKVRSDKGQFNRGNHYGQYNTLLNGLVKAGTINQAQADAIQELIKPVKEATPVVTPTTPVEEATPAKGVMNRI